MVQFCLSLVPLRLCLHIWSERLNKQTNKQSLLKGPCFEEPFLQYIQFLAGSDINAILPLLIFVHVHVHPVGKVLHASFHVVSTKIGDDITAILRLFSS